MSLRLDLGRKEDGGTRLDEGGSTLTEHTVGIRKEWLTTRNELFEEEDKYKYEDAEGHS